MAAEQEGEGFPGEVSPALFARRLEQLGQFAYRFQAPHLPASGPMPPVIDGRPRWSRADLSAFHRYHDFDTAVRIVGNGDVAETLRHVPKVTEVYEAVTPATWLGVGLPGGAALTNSLIVLPTIKL